MASGSDDVAMPSDDEGLTPAQLMGVGATRQWKQIVLYMFFPQTTMWKQCGTRAFHCRSSCWWLLWTNILIFRYYFLCNISVSKDLTWVKLSGEKILCCATLTPGGIGVKCHYVCQLFWTYLQVKTTTKHHFIWEPIRALARISAWTAQSWTKILSTV